MDERPSYAYFEDVNWGLLRLWNGRKGLNVLDVGCGFATTSQHIQALGNNVTGVEESSEAVVKGSQRVGEMIQGDLTDFERIGTRLAGRRFDVIIFADVLEHLPWPIGVLKKYLTLLAESGTVIISLPNVGLWSVRLGLLFGRFQYEDTGVLDRTHLRFFTKRNALALMESAGLEPFRRTYNPGLVRPFVPLAKKLLAKPQAAHEEHDPSALLESAPYKKYLSTIYPAESAIASLWPGMLAFQMIFEARRKQTE